MQIDSSHVRLNFMLKLCGKRWSWSVLPSVVPRAEVDAERAAPKQLSARGRDCNKNARWNDNCKPHAWHCQSGLQGCHFKWIPRTSSHASATSRMATKKWRFNYSLDTPGVISLFSPNMSGLVQTDCRMEMNKFRLVQPYAGLFYLFSVLKHGLGPIFKTADSGWRGWSGVGYLEKDTQLLQD